MRSRGEIDEEIRVSKAEKNGRDTVALLQLEILLDIRDLQEQILEATYEVDKTVERSNH